MYNPKIKELLELNLRLSSVAADEEMEEKKMVARSR